MRKSLLISALAAVMMVSCQQSLDDKCAKECADFTRKKCPSRIDENTQIDSMTFDKSTHTLAYWYKLMGVADTPELFKRTDLRKALVGQIKNSTTLQAYKDAAYSFRYVYVSEKEKKVLFDTTISKKDYK